MQAAFESLPAEQRDALRGRGRSHPRLSSRQHERLLHGDWSDGRGRRHGDRPADHAARPRRPLRAGRQGRLSVVGADERDPGARGRCAASSSWWCRRPTASATRWCWRAAWLGGVSRAFTVGGAQAVAALAYGTATIPAVDKIVGPGQRLCRGREAACVRHGRHRHDRGTERDPGDRRRRAHPGLGRDGSVFAGRARRTGAGAPAEPDAALIEAVCGVDRQAAAGTAAPRHHRRVAANARRADPDARPRRGGRAIATGSRPSTWRLPRQIPTRCCRSAPCRRDLRRALLVRGARRLLRRAQPCAADRAHGALLISARRLRLRQALEPDPRVRQPARRGSGPWPRCWRAAKN